MRILKKILIIFGVIGVVLALALYGCKKYLLPGFMNAIVENQVNQQYTKEKKTTSKNIVNIAQFRTELDSMDNAKYENIDKLVSNATIKEIEKLYDTKQLKCEELVVYYLKRIEKYDINKLNSIMELNPDAISIARERDKNIGSKKGKLYGIPVILKDNIATGDKMHTTAGAYVLKDAKSDKDSFIAAQLKEEGAIILAKANMSEWANYMSSSAANGYSALGGQTHNPYGKYDVVGSSSGSAVSVASNFATVALGTETCGSMIYPSSQNSVVGIKPSLGLVSRDRIIPITEAQDTAGVVAKSVEDAALVLEVISGSDVKDVATIEAQKYKENYTKYLGEKSLNGTKIAVIKPVIARSEEKAILDKVVKELEAMGAQVSTTSFNDNELTKVKMDTVLKFGFKEDVKNYLETVKVKGVTNLNDIFEFNKQDLANRAPYGQDLIKSAINDKTTKEKWDALVKKNQEISGKAIDDVLKKADVIISLSNAQATVYSPAGYPAINIPSGYKSTGEPIGVTFVASKFEEGKLIKVSSTYEKNTNHRKAPNLK